MVETPFLQQPEKKSTTLMNDCLLMDEGFRTRLFLRSPSTKKELCFFIAMHTQMARRAHPCFKKVKNAYMQLPILLIRYLIFGSNHFNERNLFNPSHQTDSRRAAKDVDICYICNLIGMCTLIIDYLSAYVLNLGSLDVNCKP
jgi:hypothetical protein